MYFWQWNAWSPLLVILTVLHELCLDPLIWRLQKDLQSQALQRYQGWPHSWLKYSTQFELHGLWFLCGRCCPLKSLRSCWPSVTTGPFMTQLPVAPLLQSSGDHGAGRVLPGHTRTWSDCGYQEILSFWFGWISDFEKKKNKTHLVTLLLLTTILCYPPHCWAPLPSMLPSRTQHADTPPSSLTLISGTTVAHFLDPVLWFPPSFLHTTNCSTLDLNSFLPSSS